MKNGSESVESYKFSHSHQEGVLIVSCKLLSKVLCVAKNQHLQETTAATASAVG
jgi:hypothetical protein